MLIIHVRFVGEKESKMYFLFMPIIKMKGTNDF